MARCRGGHGWPGAAISEAGADASAFFYTLVETAKANGINPYDYLIYLFEKFPHAQTEADRISLLPHHVSPDDVTNFMEEYWQI